jgi:hypothetical protein
MKTANKKATPIKFCGNCDGHNCYDYPTKVFCSTRHAQSLDPIVDTLWCCSQWSPVTQDCYCVKEAKKAQNNKKPPKQ